MRIKSLLLEFVTIVFFVALPTEAGQLLDLKNDYLKTTVFDKFPSLKNYVTVPMVTQVGGPVLYKPVRKPPKKTKEQEQDEKLLPNFKSSVPAVPSAYKELLGHHWNPYEAEKIALALQQEQEALAEAAAVAAAEEPNGSLLSQLWNWKKFQKEKVKRKFVQHELKKAAQHSKQHQILRQYHMNGVVDVYRPPVSTGWGEDGKKQKKKNKKIFKQQKKKLKEKKKKQKKQQKKQKKQKKKGGGVGIQSLGSAAASPGAGGWGDPSGGRPINRVPGSSTYSNIPFVGGGGGGGIPGLGGGVPGLGTIPGFGRTSNKASKQKQNNSPKAYSLVQPVSGYTITKYKPQKKQNNSPKGNSGINSIPGYSRVKENSFQEFGGLNPIPGYGSIASIGEIGGFEKILGGHSPSNKYTSNFYSKWKEVSDISVGNGDAPAGGRDDLGARFRQEEIRLRNRARGPAKEFGKRILHVGDDTSTNATESVENSSNSLESTEDSETTGSNENTHNKASQISTSSMEFNPDSNEDSYDEVIYSPVPQLQEEYSSSSEYYYDEYLDPTMFHYTSPTDQPSYRLLSYDQF